MYTRRFFAALLACIGFSAPVHSEVYRWSTSGAFFNPIGGVTGGTGSDYLMWGTAPSDGNIGELRWQHATFETESLSWTEIVGRLYFTNGRIMAGTGILGVTLRTATHCTPLVPVDAIFCEPADSSLPIESPFIRDSFIEILNTLNTGNFLGDRDAFFFPSMGSSGRSAWVPEGMTVWFDVVGRRNSPFELVDLIPQPDAPGVAVFNGREMLDLPEPHPLLLLIAGLAALVTTRGVFTRR